MHIEDISHAVKARKLVDKFHGATRKAEHFQPLMTALFELFHVNLLDVGQFDSVVRLGRDREYRQSGEAAFIDLLVPGVMLAHAGDVGSDYKALYAAACYQANALPKHDQPTRLLITNLQQFWLYKYHASTGWYCGAPFYLAELPGHVGDFAFIAGISLTASRNLSEATQEASALLVDFRAGLLDSKYPPDAVDAYVLRLLLILSMDHNGTFERGSFYRLILGCTREDGSDVGERIASVFEALDTPLADRQNSMTSEVRSFPYVNGHVFKDRLRIAYFSQDLRLLLLELIAFGWRDVSLELIGEFYQKAVALSPRERRWGGRYYTPARLTLQVVTPLFLSELQADFEQARHRRPEREKLLHALWDRLAAITVLDPACGSGYFLTATYLALRALETSIIVELLNLKHTEPVSCASRLSVSQMVGIDLDPTAARIAWVSLLLADQRANNELSRLTGRHFARLPLPPDPPSTQHQDALAIDWTRLLPPGRDRDHFTYIIGNPPYGGAKLLRQGGSRRIKGKPAPVSQLKQVQQIEKQFDIALTRLDLSACWLIKTADMIQRSQGRTRAGLVVTSSLTQGEQVHQLWPTLFDRYNLDIVFGQQPTQWEGSAAVTVVVLGLAARDGRGVKDAPRMLFEARYTDSSQKQAEVLERQVPYISAYLRAAATPERARLVIPSRRKPICDNIPTPRIGTKPVDGGHLIIKNRSERDKLLARNPDAASLLRPYVGGYQLLYDTEPSRWILVTSDVSRGRLQKLGEVRKRLGRAQTARAQSPSADTRNLAPGAFHVTTIPTEGFIVIPEIVETYRPRVPIGWLTPPTVPSSLLKVVRADPYLFGILSSRLHLIWLRAIGGTLDAAPRYSIRVVYNNFPFPTVDATQRALISELAEAVLAAREAERQKELARAAAVRAVDPESAEARPYCPLVSLYSSDTMPKALLAAHRALDAAVEKLFRPTGFTDTDDIVDHLLDRYVTRLAEITP
jgi:hypothetical protein